MAKISPQEKKRIKEDIKNLLSGYEINDDAPSGQNGFSTNFLITKNGQVSLAKVIVKSKLTSEDSFIQASEEFKSLSDLNNPNIVSIIDRFESDDYLVFAFPYLQGNSLGKKISDGHIFSEREIISIANDLLNALIETSRINIVHQDIKPENIFIKEDGRAVLLDFGSSRYQKSPFTGKARANYAYSSPEQIIASNRARTLQDLRKTLDGRSDIFCLGIVLYKLCTTKHPFENSGIGVLADNILNKTTVPPIDRDDLSQELKSAITQMLAWSIEKRPNAIKALSLINSDVFETPTIKKGCIYYNLTNNYNVFVETNRKKSIYDGLIVDASKAKFNSNRVQILARASELLIDPQFYLVQKSYLNDKLKKLPYAELLTSFEILEETVGKIESGQFDDLIYNAMKFQIDFGVTAITVPFLFIQEHNDEAWMIDQALSQRSLMIIKREGWNLPIIKGVSISSNILESSSKNNILAYITSTVYSEISGYMVLLESQPGEPITSVSWLKNAKIFLSELMLQEKAVIWSKSDLAGLIMPVHKLSISLGEEGTQRKFNLNPSTGYGKKGKFYFVETLFLRIKWPEAYRAISTYHEAERIFVCHDDCCNRSDFEDYNPRSQESLAVHFLYKLSSVFKKYQTSNTAESDIKIAIDDLQKLKSHSPIAKASIMKDFRPTGQNFLTVWLDSFYR